MDLLVAVVPRALRVSAVPAGRPLVLPSGLVGLGAGAVVPADPRIHLLVGAPPLVVAPVDVVRRRPGYLATAARNLHRVVRRNGALLLPVFWLPWVGLYIWYRALRRTVCGNPWMYLLFGGYGLGVRVDGGGSPHGGVMVVPDCVLPLPRLVVHQL